jgi:uncharacterized protein YjiS (DUF1127 family)
MSIPIVVSAITSVALGVKRAAIAAWRRRRHKAAVKELMRLDDKTLADIGLHRCEILSAVIEADDVYVPRERRHARTSDRPGPAAGRNGNTVRHAGWRAGIVQPLATAEPRLRPANEPIQPRRSA